jgi:hypothetical protein
MEARNTRPGGSVVPAKKSTAPGFPSQKPNQKNKIYNLRLSSSTLKKRGAAEESKNRGPPTGTISRRVKREERRMSKEGMSRVIPDRTGP